MKPFMFSMDNIKQGYYPLYYKETLKAPAPAPALASAPALKTALTSALKTAPESALKTASAPKTASAQVPTTTFNNIDTRPFTPSQKDKLFWCFFIIIHGYEEYEINRTSSFSIEKKIKIEAVEQLKMIKDKLKELKLKRTELEYELVHQPTISIKGLYALCLIHNVSITYVYNRKYCELNKTDTVLKRAIIIQNEKKEDSLRWMTSVSSNTSVGVSSSDNAFYKKIQEEYWHIENIQKPLKAVSAYTIKELQDISQRLQIDLYTTLNDKQKPKSKSKLYQEILQHI